PRPGPRRPDQLLPRRPRPAARLARRHRQRRQRGRAAPPGPLQHTRVHTPPHRGDRRLRRGPGPQRGPAPGGGGDDHGPQSRLTHSRCPPPPAAARRSVALPPQRPAGNSYEARRAHTALRRSRTVTLATWTHGAPPARPAGPAAPTAPAAPAGPEGPAEPAPERSCGCWRGRRACPRRTGRAGRPRTGAVLLAAAALLMAGCSSGSTTSAGSTAAEEVAKLAPLPRTIPAALTSYYAQKPAWRDCGVPGFQCATLK